MDTQMIDTIALIRQIRNEHYEFLRGKTHAERIAFYRAQAQKMQDKIVVLWPPATTAPVSQVKSSIVVR
jgi:hypothetical protein